MRYKNKVFLFIVFAISIISITIYVFNPDNFQEFKVELMASALGVFIAFYADRIYESKQKKDITKKIIENIYYELENNLEMLKKIDLESDSYTFDLFKDTSWDMFNSRLELENIEILFELGGLYHRFKLFNEGMKNEALGGGLSNILKRYPNFLKKLEEDINLVLKLMEANF